MTKEFNVKGFIALIILIAVACGASAAWDIIVPLANGLWEFIIYLPKLIVPFIPFLGIEKLAWTGLIFGIVLMIASALGIWLSHKSKSNLWEGISVVVGIVSLLITLVSAQKM